MIIANCDEDNNDDDDDDDNNDDETWELEEEEEEWGEWKIHCIYECIYKKATGEGRVHTYNRPYNNLQPRQLHKIL